MNEMNITLIPATADNAPAMTEIQKAAFKRLYEQYHDEKSPFLRGTDDILVRLSQPHWRIYKILSNEELVGAIYICVNDDNSYHINRVYVHPDNQNKGIATKAIELAEKLLPYRPKWSLAFPADQPMNRRCYEKARFADTGKREVISDTLTLAIYEKDLFIRSKLNLGDTIGIPCLSHVADPVQYKSIIDTIKRLGFKVKMGEHAYSDTYGYAASAEERGADFNALIADTDVKMLLFGGGESAVEVLPFIDYELIKRTPKIISSYSDGTSVLNMIYAKTGLITYYGQGAGVFNNLNDFDWRHFEANFINEHGFDEFPHNSEWRTLHGGKASGILIGGYLSIFDRLQGHKNYHIDTNKKYILFLEDFVRFVSVGAAASAFSFIEQSVFGNCIAGLIIGHYADSVPETYLDIFRRFGMRNNVPVVYCDDFGHGNNHGILPIGINATLDADNCRLLFL